MLHEVTEFKKDLPVSASKSKYRKDVQQVIDQYNLKYVLAQFVDIHGAAKTKSVPISGLDAIEKKGVGFAGFAISGMGMQPHGPDFMVKGDLSTLIPVPWQPGYGRVVCEGYVNDQPHPYDPRYVLRKQVERLEEKGWTLNTGLEPEFSLFRRDENGKLKLVDDSDSLDKPCYDYKGLSRSRQFLENLTEALIPVGFDIYQIDHEDANGQFEINYTYSDAMNSADMFTFFRMAAGEIANDLGMICSFMPKPDPKRAGNGMHFHLSISSAESSNLFQDDTDPSGMGLSKLAYHFIAGLLAHGPALCAFCAPTVNSYKRLVVGRSLSGATWAPAFIAYGSNNRSAMVRIPYGRIELRLPDAGCNPYLVSAAIIAAGLDGIERQLTPPPACNENLYTLSLQDIAARGIETLPQSLKEAVQALQADPLFREKLGAEIVDEFIEQKSMEWVEYSRHVSDWEVQRYTEFF
ncbi:type III glutamate--ammonia ligase [Acinetobacter puyangensis]|uniref:Gamma-glutamylmethylamide synthetase n=1 Tax=Acinetobacter puyangensis TaxID=1096779 RepID=A0A240EBJ0_9GAMM|nr:type III glutamate--ammonia ligase [Acinetobacter puyangensis]SNX45896.1 gamma-glutamylmethylamide synthetase [Acinetobacter puyangensis]